MGELSMEKLHFQAKSAANFVKLGCTILFEKGNRMDDLGAVWHEYFNGDTGDRLFQRFMEEAFPNGCVIGEKELMQMYNVKGDLECYTRPNIVRRLDKMGFFDAPASINHHGAYSGALFDHSLAVTGALLDYTDKMGLTWSDARSPYIVGMFHDLCKCDNYKVVDGKWKYNPNMILPGHGEKSIIMLQNIAPDALTNEEIACIRWHMGAFDDRNNWEYYTRAVAKFPNVMYTHTRQIWQRHTLWGCKF